NCKQEVELPPHAVLAELGFEPQEIDTLRVFRGAGCKICNGTGYKGRVGLYEVMEITSEIKEAIIRNATSVELRRVAVENGMITLRRSGLQKVRDEMTTIEVVVRETVHSRSACVVPITNTRRRFMGFFNSLASLSAVKPPAQTPRPQTVYIRTVIEGWSA